MLLNLDAGERDDESEGLWALFDLLNCACGGHAGDARSMDRVAAFCARSGVRLGAHPSYPDREGFGRRPVTMTPAELTASVAAQCRALSDTARRRGVAVVAVKPHGALYHDAATRPDVATALLQAAIEALGRGVTVIGPPAGTLRDEATRLRLLYAREGFADRRLRADGTLVPRSERDALIDDPAEAAAQAVALVSTVDTICIHGDTPGAIDVARAVHQVIRG